MKKSPSKVAHNRPPTCFLCTGLAAKTAQKQKSRTTESPLMQDWVFRLGFGLVKLDFCKQHTPFWSFTEKHKNKVRPQNFNSQSNGIVGGRFQKFNFKGVL